jgi:hypothetical protein
LYKTTVSGRILLLGTVNTCVCTSGHKPHTAQKHDRHRRYRDTVHYNNRRSRSARRVAAGGYGIITEVFPACAKLSVGKAEDSVYAALFLQELYFIGNGLFESIGFGIVFIRLDATYSIYDLRSNIFKPIELIGRNTLTVEFVIIV